MVKYNKKVKIFKKMDDYKDEKKDPDLCKRRYKSFKKLLEMSKKSDFYRRAFQLIISYDESSKNKLFSKSSKADREKFLKIINRDE